MSFYCGNCRAFIPDDEGSLKGRCQYTRSTVWDNDLAHDDEYECLYYTGEEE